MAKAFLSANNLAFRNTMGFTVETFHQLHSALTKGNFLRCDMPCGCSMDTYGVLGLALHYLNSSMGQKTLCVIFGLTPAACNRLLWRGLHALQSAFRANAVPEAELRWPSLLEMQRLSELVLAREPLLSAYRPFAFMDGLRVQVQNSDDRTEQNAYYSGMEGHACIGNVFVFAADGCIIWWRGNCPGSWHDITIASHFLASWRDSAPQPYRIVADSGFIRHDLNDCLLLSRSAAALLRSDINEQQLAVQQAITSVRQAAEWGMRALQGCYGRLHTVLSSDHQRRACILECIAHLHNFQTRTVGVNQIRTVFDPDRCLNQHTVHTNPFYAAATSCGPEAPRACAEPPRVFVQLAGRKLRGWP
jgi:hypothetical protein